MMHGSFENTTYKDHYIVTLLGTFSLKMSIFCNIYLVYEINN